ncbi:DUF1080 domain-containing protein, partial [Candidatus Latescibacterota bacterium]
KRVYIFFLFIITGYIIIFSNTPVSQDTVDGFVSLFNGRNFEGWVNVNCAPETWNVHDGMIVCSGTPDGILRTVKQFENYILELEWCHMKKDGNAGLFIHSDPLPDTGAPFPRSHEIQIRDGTQGDIFSLHGATMTPDKPHQEGRMFSSPSEYRMKPAAQWNHYRVESRDGTITLAVNGKIVTRGYYLNPRKGYICLESEGSEIHFRNIRIREFPGSNPPPDVIAGEDQGFRALYNGLDLRGWKQVPGNKGHWRANDRILEYDGKSEASGDDRHLTTEEEFEDFILIVDWRLPAEPVIDHVPVILPDGSSARDSTGKELTVAVLDGGDSGIYLRGSEKCQVNIWNWPVGSGELWGYRTDGEMPPEVQKAATPIMNADNPVGEWNRFEIKVIGDTVTVILNGKTVIQDARLPGMPERGPIKLQHHGDLVEFANIFIKELD